MSAKGENMPENEFMEIASRLKELREACEYSIPQLAKELGIDASVYASYEESGADIPISVIYQISRKFNVDFAEILTGTSAKLRTYHVVRKGEGKEIDRYPGYSFKDLAYRFSKKIMQPLLVTIDPSDKPAALVTHSGEEFNMVLSGSVVVTLGDKEFTLDEGDTIYFNPEIPHGQRCSGNAPVTFLTMIAE